MAAIFFLLLEHMTWVVEGVGVPVVILTGEEAARGKGHLG